MQIEVRSLAISGHGSSRVELDYDFLGTGWMRRVYKFEENKRFRLPPTAHAHDGLQILLLLSGEGTLAYMDEEVVHYVQLNHECCYSIPPRVLHQIEMRAGVLEMFAPIACVRLPKMVVTVDDYFGIGSGCGLEAPGQPTKAGFAPLMDV